LPSLDIILIALDESSRNRGLMHTEQIGENQCALFVFDSPASHSFWNKNVDYSIDVAFFDEDATLVEVNHLDAQQTKSIKSDHKKVKYVLETRRGWFQENEVELGTSMWTLVDLPNLKRSLQ
jgi:uncharacterized membrane protein (UPF0127 family)